MGPTALQKEPKSLPLPFVIWPATLQPQLVLLPQDCSPRLDGSLRTVTPAVPLPATVFSPPLPPAHCASSFTFPSQLHLLPVILSLSTLFFAYNICNALQLYIYLFNVCLTPKTASSLRVGTMSVIFPRYSFPALNITTNTW